MNNNDDYSKFTIIDEFGNEREADIVTILEVKGKEYVVYSLDTDEENCDILVSRLVKNNDGTAHAEDINDEEERSEIHNIVNNIMNAKRWEYE